MTPSHDKKTIALARPQLPIPPPLRGTEYGTFAHRTVLERMPRIGRRVLDENDFSAPVVKRLETLLEELPEGRIRHLEDTGAPDTQNWIDDVTPYVGQNWLEVPWFFAETYYYRRILEATSYFQDGPGLGLDPFAPHKAQSLAASRTAIAQLAQRMQSSRRADWQNTSLANMLSIALWGNQGDLSMWPGGGNEMPSHDDTEVAQAHVLVDDTEAVVAQLAQAGGTVRIDLLVDNAGFELISDLALIDYLIDSGQAERVVLHVKSHPTFVSDALPADIQNTLDSLAGAQDEAVREWATHLQSKIEDDSVQLVEHFFWTSPLPAWEMPQDLRDDLKPAQLVISKGDAHYRRLLGDRYWSFTAPFPQIVSYFPAPLLALRTLKSEVACGLAPARVAELNATAPGWTISGEWGVIQFSYPEGAS